MSGTGVRWPYPGQIWGKGANVLAMVESRYECGEENNSEEGLEVGEGKYHDELLNRMTPVPKIERENGM